jgi:tRNA nucleotidyltransferase/poly(A) polymerase
MIEIRGFIRKVIEESFLFENEVKRIDFNYPLPADLNKLKKYFDDNGFELYVVGGAVRDMILGKEPKDIDLVSDATPDDVKEILPDEYRIIPKGEAFGIVQIITPEGGDYEIARYREDIGKGRRPDSVKFSTIDSDALRRDLTINALYYDINNNKIIDFVNGYEDILKRNIKTVGKAEERFDEDRLRILRAFRFSARFNSNLDQDIIQALRKDNSLQGISEERIRDEFLKGIKSAQSVVKFLSDLDNYGLLKQILNGLNYNSKDFIETHDHIVLLANLLKNNSVKDIQTKLNQLKYTLEEIKKISFLVEFLNFNPEKVFYFKVKENVSKISSGELLEFAKFNSMNMNLVSKFIDFELSVSGDDLLSKGFKGAALGQEKERLETNKFLDTL